MSRKREQSRSSAESRTIERARIEVVVSLLKKPAGELVRIIMDWLDDEEVEAFRRRYLNPN